MLDYDVMAIDMIIKSKHSINNALYTFKAKMSEIIKEP